LSEHKLIKRCIKGDRKAHATLYREYAPVLFSLCLRYARNRSDAEDILQEGFTKIFDKLEQYKFEGSFEGWLKRIMVNSALGYYRKKSNVVYVEQLTDYQENNVSSHNAIDEIGNNELLAMIRQLPHGYQTVFNLYAVEGYSHKEIAEQLNVSVGTSKSQLSDARRLLRKMVEDSLVVKQRRAIG
jgi:RNA polymerase sigma factor (sigma-70 family)